jgi:hypothetical protein
MGTSRTSHVCLLAPEPPLALAALSVCVNPLSRPQLRSRQPPAPVHPAAQRTRATPNTHTSLAPTSNTASDDETAGCSRPTKRCNLLLRRTCVATRTALGLRTRLPCSECQWLPATPLWGSGASRWRETRSALSRVVPYPRFAHAALTLHAGMCLPHQTGGQKPVESNPPKPVERHQLSPPIQGQRHRDCTCAATHT